MAKRKYKPQSGFYWVRCQNQLHHIASDVAEAEGVVKYFPNTEDCWVEGPMFFSNKKQALKFICEDKFLTPTKRMREIYKIQ